MFYSLKSGDLNFEDMPGSSHYRSTVIYASSSKRFPHTFCYFITDFVGYRIARCVSTLRYATLCLRFNNIALLHETFDPVLRKLSINVWKYVGWLMAKPVLHRFLYLRIICKSMTSWALLCDRGLSNKGVGRYWWYGCRMGEDAYSCVTKHWLRHTLGTFLRMSRYFSRRASF